MFEPLPRLLLGLGTGILFGILLQKGQVAKYRVIMGQFLLKDWTVVKIMGTAVVVGAVGIVVMQQAGMISLHIKPLLLGGIIAGGALFGIGMGILGYCPGTSVAACGEGRKDAFAGVVGQLIGAGLFVAFYSRLEGLINLGRQGRTTFPSMTASSPWLWLAILVIVGLAAVCYGRWGHQPSARAADDHGPQSL